MSRLFGVSLCTLSLLISPLLVCPRVSARNPLPTNSPAILSVRLEKAIFEGSGKDRVEKGRRPLAEISFHQSGSVSESTIYDQKNGKVLLRYSASFDPSGKKTQDAYLNPEGKTLSKQTYSYGADGRLASVSFQSDKQSPEAVKTFVRDPEGRIVESTKSDQKKKVLERRTYTYSDHTVELNVYEDGKDLSESTVHTLNSLGQTLETAEKNRRYSKKKSAPVKPCLQIINQYGGNGQITHTQTTFEELVAEDNYSYQFDQNGNWVSRKEEHRCKTSAGMEFISGEVFYRSITYSKEPSPSRVASNGNLNWAEEEELGHSFGGEVKEERYPVDYPAKAKQRGTTGQVFTPMLVSETGQVYQALGRITESNTKSPELLELLVQTSRLAAYQWKFNPALRDGEPMESCHFITFVFDHS